MDFEKLLKKCVKEDGTLDMDAAVASLKAEVGKAFVSRADFNAKNNALKDLQQKVDVLEENASGYDRLKEEVSEWKSKAQEADSKRERVEKDVKIKEALRKAGGTDVDYLAFRLGDVECSEDGTWKDWDAKLAELKKDYGNHFKPSKGDSEDAFQTVKNGLQGGGFRSLACDPFS